MTSHISGAKAYPLALALLVLTTCALFFATPWSSAQAATITGAIKEVTLTPANGDIDNELRVDLKWCVPNGSKDGDTFTMTLPRELNVKVSGFPLNSPSGDRVANATIVDDLVTFTLTKFAETHNNVCGTAWFRSWYDQGEIKAGATTTIEFTTGGQVFRQDVTPTDNTALHLELEADKNGSWSNDAQTRAAWEVVSPSAPDSSWNGTSPIVITDDAPEGMEFDCATDRLWLGRGWSIWGPRSGEFTLECTPERIVARFTGALPKDHYVYLTYDTVVTNPDLTRYTNTAGVLLPNSTEPAMAADSVTRRDPRTTATKVGAWENAQDQKAIRWTIRTPDAPAAGWSDGAKIQDHAQAGQKFRCDSLKVQLLSPGVGTVDLDLADLGTCSASDLSLNYTGALAEGQSLRVDIVTDITDRARTAYDNIARITVDSETSDVHANRVERSDAGGDGNGDNQPVDEGQPGTGNSSGEVPTAGETPGGTGTATAQGAPAAPTGGAVTTPDQGSPNADVLPETGGPQLAALLAGLALVAGGATFVVRNRKATR